MTKEGTSSLHGLSSPEQDREAKKVGGGNEPSPSSVDALGSAEDTDDNGDTDDDGDTDDSSDDESDGDGKGNDRGKGIAEDAGEASDDNGGVLSTGQKNKQDTNTGISPKVGPKKRGGMKKGLLHDWQVREKLS